MISCSVCSTLFSGTTGCFFAVPDNSPEGVFFCKTCFPRDRSVFPANVVTHTPKCSLTSCTSEAVYQYDRQSVCERHEYLFAGRVRRVVLERKTDISVEVNVKGDRDSWDILYLSQVASVLGRSGYLVGSMRWKDEDQETGVVLLLLRESPFNDEPLVRKLKETIQDLAERVALLDTQVAIFRDTSGLNNARYLEAQANGELLQARVTELEEELRRFEQQSELPPVKAAQVFPFLGEGMSIERV